MIENMKKLTAIMVVPLLFNACADKVSAIPTIVTRVVNNCPRTELLDIKYTPLASKTIRYKFRKDKVVDLSKNDFLYLLKRNRFLLNRTKDLTDERDYYKRAVIKLNRICTRREDENKILR